VNASVLGVVEVGRVTGLVVLELPDPLHADIRTIKPRHASRPMFGKSFKSTPRAVIFGVDSHTRGRRLRPPYVVSGRRN